ncbi:MAG: ferrous iron transport protein B [Chloroflexi bacterium]|nr:ferrous iron transport protein B [Chloroflexota bacterium]
MPNWKTSLGRLGFSPCPSCPLAAGHVSIVTAPTQTPDVVIALAGNPNTGKSTLFNALTGLRQHTGNWPGKTVTRAEGYFRFHDRLYKVVDLPGTYSLFSASEDEEVARDFLLFGQPDAVIITVDATALERNLNLVLQILEITDRAVIAVNMMDEARRKGLEVNTRALSRDLGVPAVPLVARTGEGLYKLLQTVEQLVTGEIQTHPRRVPLPPRLQEAVDDLLPWLERLAPGLPNLRWVALRLLDGDERILQALRTGELRALAQGKPPHSTAPVDPDALEQLLDRVRHWQWTLGPSMRDEIVQAIYAQAERIARRAVHVRGQARARDWDLVLDRLLTSPSTGIPIMLLLLALVFWLTIQGANYPSEVLAKLLFSLEAWGAELFARLGAPDWLTGFVWHGVYRGMAWVVSVMLPPMAIFFPLFSFLEDLGVLPRVAFNLDFLFRKVGAHGKQALTMAMGFGCNAAGVVATRIIDSPRERLIAILTNAFVPCNGRYPTLIMLATVFIAAHFPAGFASIAAALAVLMSILLGVAFTFLASWFLSRTVLRGEPSAFTLELPPFRRPSLRAILYRSFVERTWAVLVRAVTVAAPAGGVIWLLANVSWHGQPLAQHFAVALDPLGRLMGLDGVILLSYIIAIPANEIVVPTMIMIYQKASMMTEVENLAALRTLLVDQAGWTMLTALNMMLFVILHNPCATTILTIYKETRSLRWTVWGALLPLGFGVVVTITVASLARLLGFG